MKQDVSTDAEARDGARLPQYRWILLFVLLIATAGGVFAYWHYAEIYPSTDNAYTGADVVRVASQVSGPVARVYVQDDDNVAAGDPLFDIDPTLYDAALRNARAQFDAAASAAGTAGDALKAAATKLEEKGAALEDCARHLSQGQRRAEARSRPQRARSLRRSRAGTMLGLPSTRRKRISPRPRTTS